MTYEEALAIAEQRALNGTRAYALARSVGVYDAASWFYFLTEYHHYE